LWLTVNIPCWRLPVEDIENPFFVIGVHLISPLVDDEWGNILPSGEDRTVMWSLVPGAFYVSGGTTFLEESAETPSRLYN